ncbi:MAG TPA: polysaccharide deacetylase family protein [Steroidobacteraceae bacterium]|jgi:peptidoglycan/xylan/chitin deacetylase (PgdA/CDA1 family)|nr:polysaccharide deacetylase family protein [Steroidobacteraceae bacterium]
MNRERSGDAGSQRWSPSPLLYASTAVHVGAAAALLARPRVWPWALGAVLANHLGLAAAGLWPRSQWLGPNWTRLPTQFGGTGRIAITIDDGPDPDVTPQVLARLAEYRARATFFCVGVRVERYADLARDIVGQGHDIENHSHRHRHNFSLMGPRGMAAEISRAQDSILRATGSSPRFFRAPAGLRNPFLDPVLTRLQLRLASWTRRGFDTVSPNADAVYRRLTNALQDGDILLLHDGNAARSRGGRPVILEVLPRLLDILARIELRPVTLRSAL